MIKSQITPEVKSNSAINSRLVNKEAGAKNISEEANPKDRLGWAQWMTEKGILAFIVEAEKKRPLGGNSWYARSTTDPDQITEWFDMTPDCNYGLHLGEQYVVSRARTGLPN